MWVHVEILENNAIYVDGERITSRATKWGARSTLEEFDCVKEDLIDACVRKGYLSHVKNIDTDPWYQDIKHLLTR